MHVTFGNRCGHIPASPTLDPTRPIPVGPGGYPRILAVAAERIEAFYSSPETLPSLALNPTSSQKRSERREALIRLLKSILKFLDLVSLTVSIRDSDAVLQNITIATLAKHADLELRRAERAFSDLASAGLIFTVQQRVRNPDGGFRSVPAIKRISPALFSACGLELALKIERTKAQKRLAARKPTTSPPPAKVEAQGTRQSPESFVFAFGNLMSTLFTQTVVNPQRGSPALDIERQQRWNAVALRLREQHPDWSAEAIRDAANRAMLS